MFGFIFLIAGLVMLIFGGNWFLLAASTLATKLKIPKIVVGMTLVSLATAMPELMASIKAVSNGVPDQIFGNVVGANLVNLGLILPLLLLLSLPNLHKSFYTLYWPVPMLASILFFGFFYFDGEIQKYEGFAMMGLLFLALVYLLRFPGVAVLAGQEDRTVQLPLYRMVLFFGVGGLFLWLGSDFFVRGAMHLAGYRGTGTRVAALTTLSWGTSVPELTIALLALVKKERALALGNLLGSNVFNILGVLGIAALRRPVKVMDQGMLTNDIFWLLGITFALLPLVFLLRRLHAGRAAGLALIGIYMAFLYTVLV